MNSLIYSAFSFSSAFYLYRRVILGSSANVLTFLLFCLFLAFFERGYPLISSP
jgi:hypothetical protein